VRRSAERRNASVLKESRRSGGEGDGDEGRCRDVRLKVFAAPSTFRGDRAGSTRGAVPVGGVYVRRPLREGRPPRGLIPVVDVPDEVVIEGRRDVSGGPAIE